MTKCEEVEEQADLLLKRESCLEWGVGTVTKFKMSVNYHRICVTNLLLCPRRPTACLHVEMRRIRGYVTPA